MVPGTPKKFVNAFGYAFFRMDDEFACAPLLARGGVDWDSWAIVEESPEADRAYMKRLLVDFRFDPVAVEKIIDGIGWY